MIEIKKDEFVPFLNRRFDEKCGCCNIWRKNYLLGLEELKKRKKHQFISIRQYNKDRSNYFIENKCVDIILFSDIIEILGK